MTGSIYHGQSGLPFSSALRIYEPLEAFPEQQQETHKRDPLQSSLGQSQLLSVAGAKIAARAR